MDKAIVILGYALVELMLTGIFVGMVIAVAAS